MNNTVVFPGPWENDELGAGFEEMVQGLRILVDLGLVSRHMVVHNH